MYGCEHFRFGKIERGVGGLLPGEGRYVFVWESGRVFGLQFLHNDWVWLGYSVGSG